MPVEYYHMQNMNTLSPVPGILVVVVEKSLVDLY